MRRVARVAGALLLAFAVSTALEPFSVEARRVGCGSAVGVAVSGDAPSGDGAADCGHRAARRLLASGVMGVAGVPLLLLRRRRAPQPDGPD